MSKKFTIEQTQKIFEAVGLELLETEAKGIDYKYDCKDSKGYFYKRSTHTCQHTLKMNKKYSEDIDHTFSTRNPYFYENMLHYMELCAIDKTILLTKKEVIKNIDQPLSFRCPLCGREYKQTWHCFVDKQDKCCNVCFRQKRSRGEVNTNHIDSNKFHEIALTNNLVILDGPQIRYKDKITVQDEEGYRGLTSSAVVARGEGFERFGYRNPYALDNLRLFAFKKKWDCVIYNQEYKGHDYKFKILCSCGNDFLVDADHFVAGKYQCNECRVKQSAIATKIELWLNLHQINYQKEKRFEDCVYTKTLPFDFYLEDYNSCIEVDGIGHYRPVAFGGDKQEAIKNYELRQKADNIKTQYCEDNNIPLLRLPFWEIEDDETYKKRLEQFLSIKE